MRALFILLVLLNLAFFAWQYYAPAPQQAKIAQLTGNLKPIVLLSELKHEADAKPEPAETGAASPIEAGTLGSAAEHSQPICQTLGPFRDRQQLDQVKTRLSPLLKHASIRAIQERRLHRYWIYLPAEPSRQQAVTLSRKLADAKIKDYYIVLSGENKNSISLGHFRDKQHAEKRQKQLKRLGFDAKTQLIYRDFDLFWLDFEAAQPVNRDQLAVDEALDDEISVINRACKP